MEAVHDGRHRGIGDARPGCLIRQRNEQVVGLELYRYVQEQAQAMGWVLNLKIKGHRVSDFPHAVHRGGDLGDFEHYPNQGLWILEIQIAHPDLPYGAFFEDLLA